MSAIEYGIGCGGVTYNDGIDISLFYLHLDAYRDYRPLLSILIREPFIPRRRIDKSNLPSVDAHLEARDLVQLRNSVEVVRSEAPPAFVACWAGQLQERCGVVRKNSLEE